MRAVATVVLAMAMGASPAFAKKGEPYIEVDFGALMLEDMRLDVVASGAPSLTVVSNQLGYDAALALGYDLGPVRLEVEGSAKRSGIDEVNRSKFNPFTGTSVVRRLDASGHASALSVMANALVDIGDDDGLQGYFGGGVGYTKVDVSASSTTSFLDDSDGSFAWQALAGLRFPVSDKIDLGLKYRFFNADDLDLVMASEAVANPKWRSHSVMATFSYNLGKLGGRDEPEVSVPVSGPPPYSPPVQQPVAPPKAPPVQVCNTGPYVVFFDWDRSTLTDQAKQTLDSAISQYAWCGNARVMLSGHADRSGSAQYNIPLSQRRNAAVKNYLVARGIADGAISSEAYGEGQPRVETEDGVREPQNRRVEVSYGPGSGN